MVMVGGGVCDEGCYDDECWLVNMLLCGYMM